MKRLKEIEIQNALSSLEGWKMEKDGIIKSFVFESFKAALASMNRIGEVAEEMNHHPEWFNVYNRITIELTTHDASGITDNDVNLARILNSLF